MIRKHILAILILLAPVLVTAQESAAEIIDKSLDLVNGNSNTANMKMTIVRPTWQREMEIESWSLGTEYSLILIKSPARDKGTSFLKRENELWNWQPRIERSVKLPPSMMLQSWMGSDFTNDDLIKESSLLEDYDSEIIGSEVVEGRECHVIELLPKPEAPVVWGKIITWISKEQYMTMKSEFYDEDGYLVNTMYGKNVETFDGRQIPSVLEVVPADEEGQKTVVEYQDIDFNVGLEPSFFSIRNMKNPTSL